MTTKTLPHYTGPDVTCTKCGHTGALTEYRGHGDCLHGDLIGYIGFRPNERLHRECERCGHQWDEATVEQPATRVVVELQDPGQAMRNAVRDIVRRDPGSAS